MFHLNEPSLKAIHDRLSNDLNGYIDQVNTELIVPDFPVEYPVHVYDFIPTTNYLTDFPVVSIGDGPIDFLDDTGWSATGSMDFAIVIWVKDYDQRALAWRLRRLMTAVANCVLDGRSLAAEGGGWGVTLGQIEPGPVLGRKQDPTAVLGMRALTLNVRDEQDA